MRIRADFRTHHSEVDIEKWSTSEETNGGERNDFVDEPPAQIIGTPEGIVTGLIAADDRPFSSDRQDEHEWRDDQDRSERQQQRTTNAQAAIQSPTVDDVGGKPLQ